jgi:hypothetical protein
MGDLQFAIYQGVGAIYLFLLSSQFNEKQKDNE